VSQTDCTTAVHTICWGHL